MIDNVALNNLLKTHSEEKTFFDGMINDKEYFKSKKKIVFLLKERNMKDQNKECNEKTKSNQQLTKDNRDLITLIKEEFNDNNAANMWLRIYDWTSIAISEDKELNYKYDSIKSEYSNKKPAKLDLLNPTAILNLNKEAGGSSTTKTYFEKAEEWADVWKHQLEILSPDLVVCCGTYYETSKALSIASSSEKVLETGAKVFYYKINNSKVPFLEFLHPGCRLSDKILYTYFEECYKYLNKEV